MAGIVIRKEQLESLRTEKFVSWLVQEVRRDYPQTLNGTPERRVADMVKHGLQRGRLYGLSGEPALADFVFTMFLVAPVFDEYPPIQKILLDPAIAEEQKFPHIHKTMTAGDWKASHTLYKETYRNRDTAWSTFPVLRGERKESGQ